MVDFRNDIRPATPVPARESVESGAGQEVRQSADVPRRLHQRSSAISLGQRHAAPPANVRQQSGSAQVADSPAAANPERDPEQVLNGLLSVLSQEPQPTRPPQNYLQQFASLPPSAQKDLLAPTFTVLANCLQGVDRGMAPGLSADRLALIHQKFKLDFSACLASNRFAQEQPQLSQLAEALKSAVHGVLSTFEEQKQDELSRHVTQVVAELDQLDGRLSSGGTLTAQELLHLKDQANPLLRNAMEVILLMTSLYMRNNRFVTSTAAHTRRLHHSRTLLSSAKVVMDRSFSTYTRGRQNQQPPTDLATADREMQHYVSRLSTLVDNFCQVPAPELPQSQTRPSAPLLNLNPRPALTQDPVRAKPPVPLAPLLKKAAAAEPALPDDYQQQLLLLTNLIKLMSASGAQQQLMGVESLDAMGFLDNANTALKLLATPTFFDKLWSAPGGLETLLEVRRTLQHGLAAQQSMLHASGVSLIHSPENILLDALREDISDFHVLSRKFKTELAQIPAAEHKSRRQSLEAMGSQLLIELDLCEADLLNSPEQIPDGAGQPSDVMHAQALLQQLTGQRADIRQTLKDLHAIGGLRARLGDKAQEHRLGRLFTSDKGHAQPAYSPSETRGVAEMVYGDRAFVENFDTAQLFSATLARVSRARASVDRLAGTFSAHAARNTDALWGSGVPRDSAIKQAEAFINHTMAPGLLALLSLQDLDPEQRNAGQVLVSMVGGLALTPEGLHPAKRQLLIDDTSKAMDELYGYCYDRTLLQTCKAIAADPQCGDAVIQRFTQIKQVLLSKALTDSNYSLAQVFDAVHKNFNHHVVGQKAKEFAKRLEPTMLSAKLVKFLRSPDALTSLGYSLEKLSFTAQHLEAMDAELAPLAEDQRRRIENLQWSQLNAHEKSAVSLWLSRYTRANEVVEYYHNLVGRLGPDVNLLDTKTTTLYSHQFKVSEQTVEETRQALQPDSLSFIESLKTNVAFTDAVKREFQAEHVEMLARRERLGDEVGNIHFELDETPRTTELPPNDQLVRERYERLRDMEQNWIDSKVEAVVAQQVRTLRADENRL